MVSASFWDIWGPKTWLAYLRAMLQGYKIKKSKGDIRQRGGDVLIDPKGIIRMHYVGKGTAGRPGINTILHIIEAEAGRHQLTK